MTGRRAGTLVLGLCWAYVAGLVGLWLLLYAAADRWWLATVVMYGPRGVWGLPLAVLAPAAALAARGGDRNRRRRRRLVWPLLAAAVALVGPVMRLCLPWQRLVPRGGGGDGARPRVALRVLTCNADRVDLDAPKLASLVAELRPDVLAFQDWTARHDRDVLSALPGWHVRRDDELFVVSRYPIAALGPSADPAFAPGRGAAAAYDLDTPAGPVRLVNLHLLSPRNALEAAMHRRWADAAAEMARNSDARRRQSAAAGAWAARLLGPTLVVGDFNTPTDSATYRAFWSDYTNAFSAGGFGFGNTHFTPHTAIRIDHVLAGPGWRCRRCWVGPNVGSAHRPVIADLEWTAGGD